jgi:hypothetical protein
MNRQDGGSAFPSFEAQDEWRGERYERVTYPVGGMTLRDYFAASVLAGLVQSDADVDALWAAGEAYKLADALLKTRNA